MKISFSLAVVAALAKAAANAVLTSYKPAAKDVVHRALDGVYQKIDTTTEVVTVQNVLDRAREAAKKGVPALIATPVIAAVELGIASGMLELGLDRADAVALAHLARLESTIDKAIDGARF